MASKNTDNPRERVTANILHSRWKRVAKLLAVIIVFCTTYALILPAITMTSQDAKCGYEEHVHEGECFDAEGNLICPLAEHEHTLACYADLAADIEAPAAWTADIPAVTGDRAYDVCNVANNQIGYRESDKNYLVSDGNQTQGYSRYGDWYSEMVDGSGARLENGISSYAYEDWDAMFASFVLYHAGIDDLGFDKDAGNWAGALAAAGKYADAADYSPEPGDLVFFTPKAGDYIHVGIVTDVNKGFLGLGIFGDDLKSLSVILGNSNNAVEEIRVSVKNRKEGDVAFETIHGYGILNPKKAEVQDVSAAEPVKDNSSANAAPEVVPADDGTANQAENDLDIQAAENASANAEDTANADSSLPIVLEPTSIPMDAVAEPNDSKDQAQEDADAPANANEDAAAKASEDAAGADALTIENADAIQDEAATAAPQDGAIAEAEIPAEWTQLEDGTYVDEDGNPVVPAVEDEQNPETDLADNTDSADAPQADTEEITGGALLEEIAGLSADSHIIGMGEEDLDSTEEAADSDVVVTVADAGISEDGTTINMAWNAVAQLPEATLPAGAIIRVDTATGKSHGMTAEAVQAWGGAATIGGEEIAFVGNEAYEVTFIGDNGLLYTWDDVQAISDASTVTFVGIHVKTLTDVEAADGTIALAFATTAKASDANAGQNYYVTKVSVNGSTGSATYTYENGVAMPADQDRVLQDAGLDVVPEKTLTASGPDYTVTMTYGEDAGIPDVAKLMVREIVSGTEEYENYIAEAKRALGISQASEATLQGRFFDIKIMTKEGEFEPAATVQVNITYDNETADVSADDISAVHIADEGAEVVKSDATVSDGQISGIDFEADSFSVYGVVYTVDFVYNGYEYCLDGDHVIYLSELLSKIGLDIAMEDITDVAVELSEVNDEDVDDNEFYVVAEEGDWLLKSDCGFTNKYLMTIAAADGTKYIVTVTDAIQETTDLSTMITGATFEGVTIVDGKYFVREGQSYGMTVSFKENLNYQFKNDGVLTYTMPQGIKVLERQEGPLIFSVRSGGQTYEVSANYVLGTDGVLNITIDTNDPEYQELATSTNAALTFHFNASFDKTSSVIDFGRNIKKELKFDESPNAQVTVEKNATFDAENRRFNYTIKVRCSGGDDAHNVNVRDIIKGDALTNISTPVVTGNSSSYTVNGTPYPNGFDYTFASMRNNEVITITYTADVDFSKDTDLNGVIEANQTENEAKVKPDGGPEKGTNYNHQITYSSGYKNGEITGGGPAHKEIKWTAHLNQEALVSLKGSSFTDAISAGSVPIQYSGNGITIVALNRAGVQQYTKEVTWANLGVNTATATGFTYTFNDGRDDANLHYVITYTTKVETADQLNDASVKNTIDYKYGKAEGYVGILVGDKPFINKSVDDYNEQEVSWKVVLHVPEDGLATAAITDILPIKQFDVGGGIWEYLLDELDEITGQLKTSINVEGLLDGEDYEVAYKPLSEEGVVKENSQFVITFSSNEHGRALKASPGGHDITITYKTKVNQTWLNLSRQPGAPIYQTVHENKVVLRPNVDSTAQVYIGNEGVDKLGVNSDNLYGYDANRKPVTVMVDGKERTAYQFDIILKNCIGRKDYLEVIDTFDTNVLELLDPSIPVDNSNFINMYIYGGNASNQYKSRAPMTYRDTSTGVVFMVNNVPTEDDGTPFSYYRLTYYLLLKENVDLQQMAAEKGGGYSLANTANWSGHEASADYEIKYKKLNKEMVGEIKDGYATFKITFNEKEATLNGGDPMTLTDLLHEMLSLDYSSVTITTNPEGREVPYRVNGQDDDTLLTFTIPDSTKVEITYRALVRVPEGQTSITIKNDAKILDEEYNFSETKNIDSSSSGTADHFRMIIAKVDGNNAAVKLPNVHFQLTLLDANGNPDTEHLKNQPIDLYTDSNGVLTITDDPHDPKYLGQGLFADVKYTLTEVEPAPEYLILEHPYYFTFKETMDFTYNTNDWFYYKVDSMQIKNWPEEGLVVQKKVTGQDVDKTKQYEFNVYILNASGEVDTSYNQKNGDDIFVNGKASFTLKDGEQKCFWGFTKGTKYKVEEVTDGYATSVQYKVFDENGNVTQINTDVEKAHQSELTQDKEVITFINAPTGGLKLKKAVTEGSSTTDEFTFKVTLTAPEGSALAATYPAVHTGNSSLTEVSVANLASTGITLKANEELTISNLPEGTTYAVTEDAKDGWVNIGTVYSNTNTAKAITKNVTDEVTITNRQNGALKLKKEATVNGEVVANSSIKYLAKGSYTFTVSGPVTDPASENAVTKTVVVTFDENGQASATLDGTAVSLADGFVVIPNLVPGKYNITENAPVNGTSLVGISGTGTSISGDTTQVEVKPGDTAAAQANATFTNNIDTGNLELTKTVSGTTDADTAFEFKIHLEPPQGVVLAATYPATLTGDDSVTAVSVVEGVITKSLKHGQKLTVKDLPAGTKYYITEEDYTSSGFVQGSTSNIGSADQEVTIPARSEGQVQTVQAQVENKFQAEGATDFKVRKTFTNGNLANHVFTFKLTQVTGENSTTQVQDNIKLASPVTVSTNATTGGTQQTLAFPLPDNFKFNQDDIGKTYWFLIEELVADSVTLDANGIDQANNIQYATVRQKWVSVAVTKNGKDLVVTKSTAAEAAADAEFTNEQLGKIEVEKIAQKAGVQDTADKTVFYFGLSSNGETFTRVANTSNVAVTSNEAAKTGWTNLPIGTYYVFEMQGETSNVPAGSRIGDYTVVNGKSTVALTAETLSAKAIITNNKELVDISAKKTWKNSDGADITDKIANASISFTLKQSLDDGSTWTEVENLTEVANTHTANVTIKLEGTASTDKSAWTVDWTNLPKYVNGQLVKYQVVETLITPADATAQGETTAMATFEPVTDKNDLANVSFTNQLPPTSLEGTKTWVDTKETHEPPTLTLTRKSAKAGSAQETVKASDGQSNLQPTWDGNNYKYSNLPKYDDGGYAYTYEVAEASFTVGGVTYTAVKKADGTYTVTTDSSSASAYTTVQNGNNFTNEEQTNFDFTKVWTTGGSENKDAWHVGQTIKVVLGRKLIPEGETEGVADAAFAAEYELTVNAIVASADSRYPITGVPNGTDYKFVISSLPTFGTMEIEGAAKSGRWEYFISEQRDGDNYNVYYYEAGAQAENHTEESVKTGGTIQNDLKTYEFPHTGSIGIMPFMMGGSLISAIALIGVSILTWMERRRNG